LPPLRGEVTEKLVELVAEPAAVVTEIGPDEAPVGTVSESCVAETTVKDAVRPLTVAAVAPVKPEPVTTTVVPTGPLVGEKPEIAGAEDDGGGGGGGGGGDPDVTVNEVGAEVVPSAVATVTVPVLAAAGTVKVTCPGETTVNGTAWPASFTELVVPSPEPTTPTTLPGEPLAGVRPHAYGKTAVSLEPPG
jgi:hypothetical protein